MLSSNNTKTNEISNFKYGELNFSTLCVAVVVTVLKVMLQSAHHIYCLTHLVKLIEHTLWSGPMLDAGNSKT